VYYMPKYFVSVDNGYGRLFEDFAIVNAKNPEEAKKKFLSYHAINHFKEYACTEIIEEFCYMNNGKIYFSEQLVKEFFAERPDYGQIYINEVLSDKDTIDLPDNIVEFMLFKIAPDYFGKSLPCVYDIKDMMIGR